MCVCNVSMSVRYVCIGMYLNMFAMLLYSVTYDVYDMYCWFDGLCMCVELCMHVLFVFRYVMYVCVLWCVMYVCSVCVCVPVMYVCTVCMYARMLCMLCVCVRLCYVCVYVGYVRMCAKLCNVTLCMYVVYVSFLCRLGTYVVYDRYV